MGPPCGPTALWVTRLVEPPLLGSYGATWSGRAESGPPAGVDEGPWASGASPACWHGAGSGWPQAWGGAV